MHSRTRAVLLILTLALATPVVAQPTIVARRGDYVRIGPPDGVPDRSFQACTARVAAILQDTLLLESAAACLRGSYDASVEVAAVYHGERRTHAVIGFAGGAVLGALAGRLAAGDGCTTSCSDGALAIVILTVAGAGAGALVGTIIGIALPAGGEWGPRRARQPVRIAGLALRPSIQLSHAGGERRARP